MAGTAAPDSMRAALPISVRVRVQFASDIPRKGPETLLESGLKLGEIIAPGQVVDLDVTCKSEALKQLCAAMATSPKILDPQIFETAIFKRESQASTGVGLGIAIPHVKIPEVSDYVVAIGRVHNGLDFDSLDGSPVHLIFMIGASDRQTRDFVKILALVTKMLKSDTLRSKLMAAHSPQEIVDVIREFENRVQ